MLKIVHCIRNEYIIANFISGLESINWDFEIDQYYAIISLTSEMSLSQLSDYKDKIIILSPTNFIDFIHDKKVDVVILHDFYSCPYSAITQIPSHVKVVWFAWGHDLYLPIYYKPLVNIPNLYKKETKQLVRGSFIYRLRKLHGKIFLYLESSKIKKAYNRIDYFSGVIESEYTLMRHNDFFRAAQLKFNYFGKDSIIIKERVKSISTLGNNILVGNSNDPTNNHIDIYEKLGQTELNNKKVISFLSYGGNEEYKKKVIKKGRELFGDNYLPITTFLSSEDYLNVVSSCGFVIMGHIRQQAMGNNITALWLGCKLFFYDNSITYQYFKSKGYHVFNINDIDTALVSPLSQETIVSNRIKLYENYSLEACHSKLKYIYRQLNAHNV